MEELVKAIVQEVRVHHGIRPEAPMPEAMLFNIQLRIKAHLAATLGIVKPSVVADSNADLMEVKRQRDIRNGLNGNWYTNWLGYTNWKANGYDPNL